jgi:hypothetical protein
MGIEGVGLLDVWGMPGALYYHHARAWDHAAVGPAVGRRNEAIAGAPNEQRWDLDPMQAVAQLRIV